MSAKSTKKARAGVAMKSHYDFSRAKRGRFPGLAGAHAVFLDDELWQHFGSDEAVIAALGNVIAATKLVRSPKKRARRAA